jgi:hypothetical protein
VVQFEGVKGRIVNPADSNHLGFFVMNPSVFNINDSTIVHITRYDSDAPAIISVDRLNGTIVSRFCTTSITVNIKGIKGYGMFLLIVSLQDKRASIKVYVINSSNR